MKVIINADDCGYNQSINERIEQFITKGLVSSTTIMANMDDLTGAKRMYDTYKSDISFGLHLNLTEGKPLRYSQELLDCGFIIEDGMGDYLFNGIHLLGRYLKKTARREILLELKEQVDHVRDLGINISHIDSHHHAHTKPSMLTIVPQIAEYARTSRIRRLRNYIPAIIPRIIRSSWFTIVKLQSPHLCTTDFFGSFEEFYNLSQKGFIRNGTVELMCHPGGIYKKEESILSNFDFRKIKNCELVNYYNI